MKKLKFLLYPLSVFYSIYSSFRNLLFDLGIIDSIEYKIPTIGIGASSKCDGQVLVTEDMLGLTNIAPKFVKKYIDLESLINKAAHQYADEVRNRKFPGTEHTYAMNPQVIRKKGD